MLEPITITKDNIGEILNNLKDSIEKENNKFPIFEYTQDYARAMGVPERIIKETVAKGYLR